MNIYIVKASQLGPVNGRLANAELALAAKELNITLVNKIDLADVTILMGQGDTADVSIIGKKVYTVANLDEVYADPKKVLLDAPTQAVIYERSMQVTPTRSNSETKRIVAITACPTGVAHTFMAAEAIEAEAKKRGWWCKVETRGSVGVGNELTAEDVASADIVIVACDIDVDLSKFAGKLMYRTKTGPALKKTAQEFDKAFNEAVIYQPISSTTSSVTSQEKKNAYKHLLTGVSYMLPMVVAGGLIVALSFAVGGILQEGALAQALGKIGGGTALALMVPVLAGYISFSIADRPGLVPGLIGGMLATSIGAGFLGGIVAGYLAGYLTLLLIKTIKLPQSLEALKPILILPLLSSLIVGLAMIFILGEPIAYIMKALEAWLSGMQTANAVILGAILGGMMCIDMGGPINKVAYAFGVGLLSAQQYAPMAAVMAGGMVPPLAMSLATFIARNKFSKAEQESGKAAFVLGLCFISEGAIPFAARDPLRVLPSCVIGGAITGGMSLAFGSQLMAPHGGLFVLAIPGAITPVFGYLLSIVVGSVVAAVIYAVIKRPDAKVEQEVMA
ncbi:PTS fructose transporter subunit IIBC [Orbus sturtevantii]|uniref:PTS fructose transporter subunit IIBC n=1 Tax=Orbus sturtevantii TaxID=3074109 RepID=UPI00370D2D97